MATAPLSAHVTNFEDVTSAEGEIITMYIVRVQYNSTSFILAKRYSDFQTLYSSGECLDGKRMITSP